MRIIDLFSGAGGLTFGFYYKIKNDKFVRNRKNSFVFANEFDSYAAKAFNMNYPDIKMLNQDIRELDEKKIKELTGEDEVDLIIGGPPCQSFSTVGQRVFDDKAVLYEEYFRILNIVRPKMFLFENVKGILSMKETSYKMDENDNILYTNTKNKETGIERRTPIVDKYGKNVIDIIAEKVANIDDNFGYNISKKVLNAVNFGVPENRERVFIVGIRKDLDIKWEFPEGENDKQISIKEAISDLPPVHEGEVINRYIIKPQNAYQNLMRGDNEKLTCHYCGRYGDKIRTVIENVKQGEGKNEFNMLVEKGLIDKKYRLTSGFANTYGRLVEDQPSTTITNNMCTPSGLRCIHYEQNRALTPREGARIQSFPDWFLFNGEKAHVTSQIGNAVPPLLAIEMAKQIEKTLKGV
ncbi:MAG: DNA (cytosine-5-)-methyltransferase [Oscillospiraceae bacterium]|nr:DNA (cytosine-5-)-methyltransferase [Oscillospiraceae bacterium]